MVHSVQGTACQPCSEEILWSGNFFGVDYKKGYIKLLSCSHCRRSQCVMSKHRTTEDIFEPMYDVNSGETAVAASASVTEKEEASLEQDGMARCELSRQKREE